MTEPSFYNEPKKPQREDYDSEENFVFAMALYKEKYEVYQARLKFKRECEQEEELQKQLKIAARIKTEQDVTFANFCAKDKKGNPTVFKPALAAQWLVDNEDFKADRETDMLYYYDGKSWKDNGEVYLQEILAQILGEENRHGIFTDVLHDLKGLIYEEISFSQKIALDNGLLDVETQELLPFSVDEMPFHKLPITYNKEALCPNWESFIKQVVNPDDLLTIQEWSGFLLLPDYRFHKLLWVHGEGRNGKGVWQRTMEAVLGEDNVSSIGLEEFNGSHRFALRQLYGKLFNPCSEPSTTYPLQTALLKKATGQDTIEAEIKGKQGRLKFRNYAKITVLANKFPKVEDTTTAFKERRLFIKFPNEFTGKNQIQNIEANWLTVNDERSGILNWMLQGLKRLLDQGYFTESKTQQETEAEFLKASDTIGAFLKEMVIYGKNYVSLRNAAFESYKKYCEVMGLEQESDKQFTQRLKNTPKISVCQSQGERAWSGITLKIITDEGKIEDSKEQADTELTKRLKETYNQIKQQCSLIGPFDKKLVKDQEALTILLREGKVFEPQTGRIAPVAGGF
jgi:putative DNA primase/helicase